MPPSDLVRIEHFGGSARASDARALDAELDRCLRGAANEVWLGRHGDDYPRLAILVNGPWACVHYFPRDGHPGFQSVNTGEGPDPRAATPFSVGSPGDRSELPNDAVIPLASARAAAHEFAASGDRPAGLAWLEL